MDVIVSATISLFFHPSLQQHSEYSQEHFSLENTDDKFSLFLTPAILEKRLIAEDNQGRRSLDDDALLRLLGILNNEGVTCLSNRMQELVFVMIRITKVDHSALYVDFIATIWMLWCGKCFVEYGGMRIPWQWNEDGEFEESIEEFKKFIATRRKLPFNPKFVKETDIGEGIKKVFESSAIKQNVEMTSLLIAELMKCWSSNTEVQSDVDRAFVKEVSSSIIALIKSRSDHTIKMQLDNLEGDEFSSMPRGSQRAADHLDEHTNNPRTDSPQTPSPPIRPTPILRRESNISIEGKEYNPRGSHMEVYGCPDEGITLPHREYGLGELLSAGSRGFEATKKTQQSSKATFFGDHVSQSQPTQLVPHGYVGGRESGRLTGVSDFFSGGSELVVTITAPPRRASGQAVDDRGKSNSGLLGPIAAFSLTPWSALRALGWVNESCVGALGRKLQGDGQAKVDFHVALAAAPSIGGGMPEAFDRCSGGCKVAQQQVLKSAVKGSKRALDCCSSTARRTAGGDGSSAPAKRVKINVNWCDTDVSDPVEEFRTCNIQGIEKDLDQCKHMKGQEKREAYIQKISVAMHPSKARIRFFRCVHCSLISKGPNSFPDPATAIVSPLLLEYLWIDEAAPSPIEPQSRTPIDRSVCENVTIVSELPALQSPGRDIRPMMFKDTAQVNFNVNDFELDIVRCSLREQQAAAAGAGKGVGAYFIGDEFQKGPQLSSPTDGGVSEGNASSGVDGQFSRCSALINDRSLVKGFEPWCHEKGFLGTSPTPEKVIVKGASGGGSLAQWNDRGDSYGTGLPHIPSGIGLPCLTTRMCMPMGSDDPLDDGQHLLMSHGNDSFCGCPSGFAECNNSSNNCSNNWTRSGSLHLQNDTFLVTDKDQTLDSTHKTERGPVNDVLTSFNWADNSESLQSEYMHLGQPQSHVRPAHFYPAKSLHIEDDCCIVSFIFKICHRRLGTFIFSLVESIAICICYIVALFPWNEKSTHGAIRQPKFHFQETSRIPVDILNQSVHVECQLDFVQSTVHSPCGQDPSVMKLSEIAELRYFRFHGS